MGQEKVWENEYRNESRLITKHNEPQKTFLRFLKYYKKKIGKDFSKINVFDAGCGTGRNANHLASMGFNVSACDISSSAISIAKERARNANLEIDYGICDLGRVLKYSDTSIDLALDVTSSNSLDEKGRKTFISEVSRVLKEDGYLYVRALCLDGDKNAKNLIKNHPGKEENTYKMPGLGLVEKVFSKEEFQERYSRYFEIEKLIKESGYTKFGGQSYKRNFWVGYLRKK